LGEEHHPYTEMGNALRFVARHRDMVRYVPAWKRWLVWDGTRWAVDHLNRTMVLAKETVTDLAKRAAEQWRDTLNEHAERSQSLHHLQTMIRLAESEPDIPVTPLQLDADPWALTVENGTLDLRSGGLHAHRPADLITKLAPVLYDSGATAPNWDQFLKRIMAGDDDVCRYLQRVLGYTLTGDTREQVFFVLYGAGANGKSTLLNTVRAILGDYAKDTPSQTLLVKPSDGIRNDLARLHGARFVTAIETDPGKQLAKSQLKQITGGDPITARFLYGEYFEYVPQFKLFMATNHRPRIKGTDEGIWRRVHLIPFEVAIPKEEQDVNLGRTLLAEGPGILRWMVEGCLAWQRDGLSMPSRVKRATTEYRREEDVLARFLDETFDVDEAGRIPKDDMYQAYAGWCAQHKESRITKKALGRYLKEQRGFRDGKSGSERYWTGLRLQQDAAD